MAKITFARLDKLKARIADSKAQLEATVLAYAETCNDYQLAVANAKVYQTALDAAKDALEGAEGADFTALQTCVAGLSAAYDEATLELIAATNEKRNAAKLLNAAQNTYARHNASFFTGLMTLPGAIDEYLGNGAEGPADDESAPGEDWNDEALDAAADAHAFNRAEADTDAVVAEWRAAADAEAADTEAAAASGPIFKDYPAPSASLGQTANAYESNAAWLARLDAAADADEAAAADATDTDN